MLLVTLWKLPQDARRLDQGAAFPRFQDHFRKPDRVAGMIAAFLTSGGLVGYVTYIGAWLKNELGATDNQIAFVFMLSGIAAVGASPFSGWLADHLGKKTIIIGSNILLAPLFLIVTRLQWGMGLWLGIVLLGVCASARQAPLHALTTEIVGPEIRGEYTAFRNAASQTGIAVATTISAYAFDSAGFAGVGAVAAILTLLVPVSCIWLRER
jgi:DHA1 family purine base/nucleoside efflux pump-like MFS transporter